MAHASRYLAGLALLALGTSVAACGGSPGNAAFPTALSARPASGANLVTPAIKYPLEFVNRSGITIRAEPNGSKCMNRNVSPHTLRPNARWEPSVDTKGSGSCVFAPSIFYVKFLSGTQTLFDIQFEKKVHTPWVARYAGKRVNFIKLCWFGGGGGLAGGLGVLQAENRHCSPAG
jgi:hypothetical protein